ncbi:MAG: sugar-binding domain-containing protein, partial [Opitutales bacterium]
MNHKAIGRKMIVGLAVMLGLLGATRSSGGERQTLNFNPDWRFTRSDPAGAATPEFDDSAWARVSTPHTFNDTDTFAHWSPPGHKGEIDQWSGRTWYRKTFVAPGEWAERKVYIEFEAARQIAEVYLNGEKLGVQKTGFTPFGFDLTPHLRPGARNVLAVMVDNRFMRDPAEVSPAGTGATRGGIRTLAEITAEHNALAPERLEDLQADQIPWNNPHWHPAHGGLYRNVWLHVTDPLHITLPLYSFLRTEGPYVYATDISADTATVHVEVPVTNGSAVERHFDLAVGVLDADGHAVLSLRQAGVALRPAAGQVFAFSGTVTAPRFWEPDYPHLYHVVLTLSDGGAVIDRTEVPLGIRVVRWDPLAGFFINGRHVKLHGWGQKPTDEWPGLGAALPDWLHDYTLHQMKEAGGNFLRWGHCAAGPAQIAAGDRFGIITLQPGVDGEAEAMRSAWELRASAFRDVVIYFRNNPSILIWEGGNQKLIRAKAAELRGYMDRYDPHGGRAYTHRRADQVTAEFMNVGIGTEGGREIAQLPVVEGEYDREESPRRVWDDFSPPNFGYAEAKGQTYQLTAEQFAVNEVAQYVKKLGAPEHCGGANWIFSDTTSGGRVSVEVARAGGEVDGVRLPKEAYYACAAMFRDDPQVHIIGHWTYPAGTKKNIYVVANTNEVELFLNGRSLGRGQVSDKYLFTFAAVSWEPGELKAVGRTDGRIRATHRLHTTGAPVALRLTPLIAPGGLRADGADIALFDVEAVDAGGARCPTFQRRVDFGLSGPGVWRGGYNSGKLDSINHPWLDLEAGINRVAIRATRAAGPIRLHATAAGLAAADAEVDAQSFAAPNGMSTVAPAFIPAVLPAVMPAHGVFPVAAPAASQATAAKMAGRYVKAFNYSGPSYNLVHVEILARDGKNPYVDVDTPFTDLPPVLVGADWVQAANLESLYHAVDLMQLEVKEDGVPGLARHREQA